VSSCVKSFEEKEKMKKKDGVGSNTFLSMMRVMDKTW
jgi:hypothetical protein